MVGVRAELARCGAKVELERMEGRFLDEVAYARLWR
jgi:hypothetical protein